MHAQPLCFLARNSCLCNFDQILHAKTLTLSVMSSPVYLKPNSEIVLCIDDNQDVLECEKAFLESFGYTVLIAPSGGKGLELAFLHSIDVVIVDYLMPEMNGLELAVKMRRLRPHAPIIMLSGAMDIPPNALSSVDVFIAKNHLASQLLPAIVQLQAC